jgi:hypothetical protein
MRTKPLLGRKAWFGPRRMGWGLSPVSPEGWAVPLVAVIAIICAVTLTQPWIAFVVVAALIIVIFLKGTSPGGARKWEEYQAQKQRRDA